MSAVVAWDAYGRCVRTLVLRLVQPVNDDVALVDSQSIEILPYSHGQLVFVHSSFRFGAQHGRRHASDPLAEDDVTERVLERRRGVEAVGSSVALEDGRLLRRPFHLVRNEGQRWVHIAVAGKCGDVT